MSEAILRAELEQLPENEILALCYRVKGNVQRLRLYMDIFRQRSGLRAQFASCLLCFDLARMGEKSCQQDFLLLADTMSQLATDRHLVEVLIGSDPYLQFIWELCQEALSNISQDLPVSMFGPQEQVDQPDRVLPLFDDQTNPEFEIPAALQNDNEVFWRKFDDAIERFLGGVMGVPSYDPNGGFRHRSNKDSERMEACIHQLQSCHAFVPPARGFLAIIGLYYGSVMRNRTLFGSANQRKQSILRQSLDEFVNASIDLTVATGAIHASHAESKAWPNIVALLTQAMRWQLRNRQSVHKGFATYDPLQTLSDLEQKPVNRFTLYVEQVK